jgi:SAM-dependent methyltransferase
MQRCLICSDTNIALYLDDSDDSLDTSKIGSSRTLVSPGKILRCRACGFGFRENRFNETQLADLYSKMNPGTYQAEMRGRIRTAGCHLRIVNKNSTVSASPRHLLDVGCASGVFLLKALDAGWQVFGIEPSETLYREAVERIGNRGPIIPEIFEKADLSERHFDAITLWDVLEHVVDPLDFMHRCRALLKPGGRLFLNVPDLDSLEARLFGAKWPLFLPEHLNYFTRPSLNLCAEKSGFRLVRFGRRCSSFSVQYVLYRLSQHRIPGAQLLSRVTDTSVGRLLIPVSLGETYAVFSLPDQARS